MLFDLHFLRGPPIVCPTRDIARYVLRFVA